VALLGEEHHVPGQRSDQCCGIVVFAGLLTDQFHVSSPTGFAAASAQAQVLPPVRPSVVAANAWLPPGRGYDWSLSGYRGEPQLVPFDDGSHQAPIATSLTLNAAMQRVPTCPTRQSRYITSKSMAPRETTGLTTQLRSWYAACYAIDGAVPCML
jgi:hypothetical protein